MDQFISKHDGSVTGVLSGWDRIVFRGTYRILCVVSGMMKYLCHASVLLRDFGAHAEGMTSTLLNASLEAARRYERPIRYLPSSATDKEQIALEILRENPVESGLVCVLKCVEPCLSFEIYRDREAKQIDLRAKHRKCLHLYHYFLDPYFGLMNARIQTWFPFCVQVCLNGRQWLARKMDKAGLAYDRHDNCFPWIEDFVKAQRQMDGLHKLNWPRFLDSIARRLNPAANRMFACFPVSYYWSGYQTEWATDVAFNSHRALASIYPQLISGAITSFSSSDILRFLGRRYNGRFSGEVASDIKERPEGIRVKHQVNGNSLKMYDKGPNVLRIETTINQPRDLKVYRTSENDPEGCKKWLPMRKGVADLYRRAQLSQKANERYLDALAHLDTTTRLEDLFAPVSRPCKRRGKRVRALRLWTLEDQALLEVINRPEFLLAGFRNRDIAQILYPGDQTTTAARNRAAARVSYRLRILRAHGIIAKLSKTRRYRTTAKGRQITTAAILSQKVTVQQLANAAA
ncbi:MAG: hypothetical protein ACE5LB_16925 [Acidiferrobacterales bacterium]